LIKNPGHGAFNRSAWHPGSLQFDKGDTTFENALLTVTITRAEETKLKQTGVKPRGARQLDLAGLSNL
jgi:hypothetical protein